MDPYPEKSSGLGLPQPSMEQSAASFGAHYAHGREIRPITMESPLPPLSNPGAMPSPIPILTGGSAIPSTSNPAVSSMPSTDSSPADDNSDALDEEWVNKAKAIVERTKNDPYTESKELSKAKADYLRLRYSKQLKIAEEHY